MTMLKMELCFTEGWGGWDWGWKEEVYRDKEELARCTFSLSQRRA